MPPMGHERGGARFPAGRDGRGRHRGGPALGRLLSTLDTASEPLSVGDIAETIGVDQPRASRLVAQGVDLGLVRREADIADARRIRIALTEKGAAMVQRIRGMQGAAVREALADFSDTERRQLARLLERLADAWPASGRGPR